MVQSSGNIPHFRRLFLALVFVLAIPVIIWLSSSYLTSLNKRSQAIQTSVDAQAVADQQQTNLQAMQALLRSRFYQIFASLRGKMEFCELFNQGDLAPIWQSEQTWKSSHYQQRAEWANNKKPGHGSSKWKLYS